MKRIPIINMEVDVVNIASAVKTVSDWSKEKAGRYVCVSNVHMCMEAFDSQSFRSVVNGADMVIPDGKPISIAQKLLGQKQADQVRGQDIMNALCALSGEENLKIGFYGGSSDSVLKQVEGNLKASYPGINITYAYSPPFRALTADEDNEVVATINSSEVDVLFVGIGCPKQEIWMAEHKEKLNCVMLGVGAAFDFIAGNKKHAPRWIQKIGFEWLFRLLSEPKRLWKRYFKHNPRYIWYFMQQWLFKRAFD
ncbi:WecB/TagA/CpsF family glycosyltransferase [Reinekea marinisedimentorum]|uniref:N-acetylglucosaminyldiphosphoundecaprenol N-acetyl-beta-D-mannosaminyltransferase n=1 Tax=Reinekea marinisedimentorum TaxID=230495 RepID=A0A4R3HWK5_9GAMM|nr:WecB/TagA/CpsF family glycosyltransferase [Reinekea marinisedimentorum]TCS37164.1 N-acetylglucosaminyldiphosphoundecaprenol N-acetyl-beta-D-mannosaminyltransferase [Reinekea marinisedimentorum]